MTHAAKIWNVPKLLMPQAEKMKQNCKPQSFLLFLLLLVVTPTMVQKQPKMIENILASLNTSSDTCE